MYKNMQLALFGVCLVAPFMAMAQEDAMRIEKRLRPDTLEIHTCHSVHLPD